MTPKKPEPPPMSSLPWRRHLLVLVVGASCGLAFLAVLYFAGHWMIDNVTDF